MNYPFYTSSEKAWKAMLDTIENAKQSIYMEMYILDDDMKDHNFLDLFKKKAREGIKIKIILDSFGSIGLGNHHIDELRGLGVEILLLSAFFHRSHRKILIVDENISFIGGVNLHESARFWNDLMIRIKGKLVRNITKSFIRSYINAGGQDKYITSKSKRSLRQDMGAWVVDHFPTKNHFKLKKLYKENINNAKESVIFVTPYFTSSRWLKACLHQAVLRGVKVEILIPKIVDHFFINRVNYFYIYKVSKLGVKFYMEPKMNHAKALVIDSRKCMIGSQNLDFLSFNLNSEVGVFFEDREVALKLMSIINKWKEDSYVFDYKTYRPLWYDYILSPIIKIFSKFY